MTAIRRLLQNQETRMNLDIEDIRTRYNHNGDRGTAAENLLGDFLKRYLPPENRMGSGEIVDTRGNTSTQLDIIITNPYHPYLNNLDGPEMFIIEGVGAVGEVKMALTTADIDVAIQSCMRYKRLKPVIQKGAMAFSNPSDTKRFIERRPYFIFAFESRTPIESIKNKLEEYYQVNRTPIFEQIDGVFCLDRGSIINFGDGNGSLKWIVENKSIPGIHITNTTSNGNLSSFMRWLNIVMEKVTYPISPLIEYL